MEKELYTLNEILEEIKTEDSKSYERIKEQAQEKIIKFRLRGGYRENAGRKKLLCPKITCSFSLPNEVIIVIEQYSKENNISKSKALEEFVRRGALNINRAEN
jgi:hypothetical protein